MDAQDGTDELVQLAQLEEDLSAVEVAIGHLDSIATDPDGAGNAAQRIALAVPAERFVLDGTTPPASPDRPSIESGPQT